MPNLEAETAKAARGCWEVVAGLIPGQPIPEHTRRWWITSDDVNGPHAAETWQHHRDAAYAYARDLCDPGMLNWVRVDWVWF